ncbi:MAG TPA: terminase family protein, partial [Microbacterium sp.]|nr:terminase family protein [Microbacterium sp.]
VDQILNRARARTFTPHQPHPKQAEFLGLACREALYGGAAGGGKSDALLMAALQYVHVPGYSAILFRRTYQDLNLPGAIMARSHEWLAGSGASWNGTDKRWTFPSGAMLSFGYLDTDRDRFRYASAEFQFIGFDELTQFPEGWYRFLFSRLRRLKGSDVPLRMRAATNPGGLGHEWVRRRFINPGAPERPFVPAKLDDNPSLDGEEYRQALAELDSTTRKQLEEGLWIRDVEGLVYRYSDGRNVIATAPECQRYLLGIDYGARSPTAFVLIGWRLGDPTVYVMRAWKKAGMSPSEAAEEVQKVQQTVTLSRIIGDTGGLGAGYVEEAPYRFKLPIEAAEKTNKLGYIKLLNGDMERGRVKIVLPECEPLATEWLELPWHEDREKEVPGFENHCADAMLYAWRAAFAWTQKEAEMGEPTTTNEAVQKAAAKRKAEFLVGRQRAKERDERFGRLPATHRGRMRQP